MTIVELLVALTIFAFVTSAVAVGMGGALGLTRNNRNRSIAANLAAGEMDLVRSTGFQSLPRGHIETVKTLDNVDYTIQRDTEPVSLDASTGACDSPPGARMAFLRVTVSVLWPNMSGAQPVESQTVLTPPVGAYDETRGHLAVKVRDRSGAATSGHVVTVSGPGGTFTQTTTESGCAFFNHLVTGAYTATLSTSSHVDPNGIASPSQSATVASGAISSLEFDYDRAATLQLTLGEDAAYPTPSGVGAVTLANTGLPVGKQAFPGTGNPRTIGAVYPFLDGYQPWVGTCQDNDPQGATPIAADPGSTTSATVAMKRVVVRVLRGVTPVSGAAVRAVHVDDDGAGSCVATDVPLGSTDPAGVVQASLPYGNWTFQAPGNNQAFLLDPSGADPAVVTVVVP